MNGTNDTEKLPAPGTCRALLAGTRSGRPGNEANPRTVAALVAIPGPPIQRRAAHRAEERAEVAGEEFIDDMKDVALPADDLGDGIPPMEFPEHMPGHLEITDAGMRIVVPAAEVAEMNASAMPDWARSC
ncbi:hypothetical protein GCM10022221_62920 [Actinocorallia aurea]